MAEYIFLISLKCPAIYGFAGHCLLDANVAMYHIKAVFQFDISCVSHLL